MAATAQAQAQPQAHIPDVGLTDADVEREIRVVPAKDRTTLVLDSMTSAHSFPFAGNFKLEDYAHGLLMVSNEDIVDPGFGFDRHYHAEMEIITWVVKGSLVHRDSLGNVFLHNNTAVQRMSAGTGITHSEYNDSWSIEGDRHREILHVIQMWIPPDTAGLRTDYQDLPLGDVLADGGLHVIATGMEKDFAKTEGRINNRYATFHAARPHAGQTMTLPDAPYVHAFVPRGRFAATTDDGPVELGPGDALRLSAAGPIELTALEDAEIVVWEMYARAGDLAEAKAQARD